MPFELTNAPASFERITDSILRGIEGTACFLDDVIVFSSSFDEHLAKLSGVSRCLSTTGLQLTTHKCHLAARQVKVL